MEVKLETETDCWDCRTLEVLERWYGGPGRDPRRMKADLSQADDVAVFHVQGSQSM